MHRTARNLVIINHAAARARAAWPNVRRTLAGAGVRFDAHETTHAGDATTRARAALREGYGTIAVVGGDGTLSEAAEGFFELRESVSGDEPRGSEGVEPGPQPFIDESGPSPRVEVPRAINPEAALAVLPAGTGDDFARGLLGRRASLEEWTSALIAHCCQPERGPMRTVDVMHGKTRGGEHGFICINVATLGIGAEVAARVAAQRGPIRRLPGEARFVYAALGALAAWRERPVSVSFMDGESLELPMNLLAIANGIYAGGGMMFAPDASVDDGMMNVLLASGLSRRAIMRELPRIRRGGHLANPRVRVKRTARVSIETLSPEDALPVEADGNVRGHTPAEFRIIPSSLKLVLPG